MTNGIDAALLMLCPLALTLTVQEWASRFFVGHPPRSPWPSPLCVCILQRNKYWSGNGLGVRLPVSLHGLIYRHVLVLVLKVEHFVHCCSHLHLLLYMLLLYLRFSRTCLES